MPYANNADLPEPIRQVLPRHAQDIYRGAFNNAYKRYGGSHEQIAHRIAWTTVKRHYVHVAGRIWVHRSKRLRRAGTA